MVQFSWIDAAINIQKQQFDEQVATPREADLLTLFCKRKGDLLTRERVLKEIWGEKNYFNRRIMDVYISKFRKYLSGDPDVEIKNIPQQRIYPVRRVVELPLLFPPCVDKFKFR